MISWCSVSLDEHCPVFIVNDSDSVDCDNNENNDYSSHESVKYDTVQSSSSTTMRVLTMAMVTIMTIAIITMKFNHYANDDEAHIATMDNIVQCLSLFIVLTTMITMISLCMSNNTTVSCLSLVTTTTTTTMVMMVVFVPTNKLVANGC